jgi:aldehyde dehydrogenase (NAD+)
MIDFMKETSKVQIERLVDLQRNFFTSQATRSLAFRLSALRKLKAYIINHEESLANALLADLHKSNEQGYLTEISVVLQELKFHIRNLKSWMEPEPVKTPLHLWPSKSEIISEPKGVVMIMSPWNYPCLLYTSDADDDYMPV